VVCGNEVVSIIGSLERERDVSADTTVDLYRVQPVSDVLTPWSTVLTEKLKRPKLLKKFPAFYGTRSFIAAFTRAHHMSLS
jgi:hypothetical protein